MTAGYLVLMGVVALLSLVGIGVLLRKSTTRRIDVTENKILTQGDAGVGALTMDSPKAIASFWPESGQKYGWNVTLNGRVVTEGKGLLPQVLENLEHERSLVEARHLGHVFESNHMLRLELEHIFPYVHSDITFGAPRGTCLHGKDYIQIALGPGENNPKIVFHILEGRVREVVYLDQKDFEGIQNMHKLSRLVQKHQIDKWVVATRQYWVTELAPRIADTKESRNKTPR